MSTQPYLKISGKGPNLVLLHGWGLHGGIWKTLLPYIETHFTVYNIDLPGFGQSDVNESLYDLNYLVDSVISILPEKYYLMGWSLGGVVATAIALRENQRVEKLITVASSPRFVTAENWLCGMDEEVLGSFIGYLNDDFKTTIIRFLTIQTMGSKTQKQDVAELKNTVFEYGLPAKKALTGGLQILYDVNLLDCLSKLDMPLLRIYGKRDTLVPVRAAKLVTSYAPHSQSTIFRKSGHAPFLSETKEFAKCVKEFLLENV